MSKRLVVGSLIAVAIAAVGLTGCEKKEAAKPATPPAKAPEKK